MIKKIIIKTNNDESMCNVRYNIHKQLKGNQDYINSRIILNDSNDRQDNSKCEIHICIDNEVKYIPNIVL